MHQSQRLGLAPHPFRSQMCLGSFWGPTALKAWAAAVFFLMVLPVYGEKPTESLEFSKWSGEINVPDPVAISFDDQGRAYVTQTQRRKSQDLDIRRNRSWTTDDVSFQSVEDKRRFLRERLRVGGDSKKQSAHVGDMNKDGVHDWRDLTVLSERIYQIEDSDQDGTADKISLFADGFDSEVTGIAAGVLAHEGDIYSTIAPDVWRLSDTDGDGKADARKVIAHGFGLHIAYAGHDMHGLTVGPDGKIYWSIGDKGISVTSAEGRRFHFPNQGGVMRCNPDGSDFEVFAHGLRNVQELAFDNYGNLFGVDNDSDQPGELERFVYIVQGMDAGWRCNYQYRGGDYNPWMAERLWQPAPKNAASYVIPPIRNYVDGPAGLVFNPGTALSPAYREYFFLTGAPNGSQFAFRAEPNGASFKMVDEHQIGKGIPLVGLNFGPDGGLYGVDWGGGYPLNQKGAVWKIDHPANSGSPERLEVKRLLSEGFADRETQSLIKLLAHADQRVRLGAQFALVKRNEAAALWKVLRARDTIAGEKSPLAIIHAIWALGQLARSGDAAQTRRLEQLIDSAKPEITVQVARIARDLDQFNSEGFIDCLASDDPRLQLHAALTLHYHPLRSATKPLLDLARRGLPPDGYLRHGIAMGLAGCVQSSDLSKRFDDQDSNVRLVAALALRHQKSEEISAFLSDADSAVHDAAARGIHDDFSIPFALPKLASTVPLWPDRGEAFVRRAINANLRLGEPKHASTLAAFAANEHGQPEMRADAIRSLSEWMSPPSLDRVTGRYRDLSQQDRAMDRDKITWQLTRCLRSDSLIVSTAAMAAVRRLKLDFDESALVQLAIDENVPVDMRIESLKTLVSGMSLNRMQAVTAGLESKEPRLRIVSLSVLADEIGEAAEIQVTKAIRAGQTLDERQNAVSLLPKLGRRGFTQIQRLFYELIEGSLDTSLVVDLLDTARPLARKSREIADLLRRYDRSIEQASKSDPLAAFLPSLDGGDSEAGKRIFNEHNAAQCARCHRVGKKGSDVGPSLHKIGSTREPLHLLRAIALPSADIEKRYRSSSVILVSGQIVQGIIKSESDVETVIVTNQGKELKIADEDIDDIVESKTSIMPPMDKVLTKAEIRDVVAYLKTLKEA